MTNFVYRTDGVRHKKTKKKPTKKKTKENDQKDKNNIRTLVKRHTKGDRKMKEKKEKN